MHWREAELREQLEKKSIPPNLWQGIIAYVMEGKGVGHFLSALFENNLMESFAKADDVSRASLFDLCLILYNWTPAACWGSREKVEEWQARGGLLGVEKKAKQEQEQEQGV